MVVQHNINAMTAYNKLNVNVTGLKKSSEKLASGYRINRAGDDAAGLAVSEKMRSQIKGLNQAVRNAQDGINMIQTFEGAATNTHEILQRMKVLAEESANGTYDNTTDRDAIQLEFDQLNDELNQIADTDFNGRVALNGGQMADGTFINNPVITAGKPHVATNDVADDTAPFTYKSSVRGTVDYAGNGNIIVDGVNLTLKAGKIQKNDGTADGAFEVGNATTKTTYNTSAEVKVTDGKVSAGTIQATTVYQGNEDTTTITIYGQTYSLDWTNNKLYDADGKEAKTVNGATVTVTGNDHTVKIEQEYKFAANVGFQDKGNNYVGNIDVAKGVSVSDAFQHGRRNLTYSDSITLQTGARSKDAVDFTFAYTTSGIGDLNSDLDISARGLGTAQLSLVTAEKANEAIDHIDNAINKVSMVRATFGSIQNRLEYKIDNLTTTSTNLQEAESNIRDTDMANEMMNYTKYSILQQAAQSMLAQANQQPQSILQLLG